MCGPGFWLQLLGFLEVVRREGPRETSFLQVGNPQGSDTLSTMVEGLRYVMTASPATLQAWAAGPERDHPGELGWGGTKGWLENK